MAEEETHDTDPPFAAQKLEGLQHHEKAQGARIEPGRMPVVDISKLPGMSERIEQAKEMQQGWLGKLGGAAAHDDPVELDLAKRKLLDQNWSND